jgi:1-acyl-sn-glycerol-3-phosphate acyltransferase
MLGATVFALVAAPILAPVLVALDLVRGRWRLPMLRVYAFTLQYLVNDSVEIVLAPVYWLWAGLGRRLYSPQSLARHERLMYWSVALLEKRARQLLGLSLEVTGRDLEGLKPGPVIVISRHTSVFDSSLPGLLYQRIGFRIRGVIMAELLADPGFDLIYGRLGSVFIPRDDGERARAAIETLAQRVDERTAILLFPEGRLFTPSVRDRSLERLAQRDPDRAAALQSLHYLLPPRPGGFTALLERLPEADVVVIDHRGLDGISPPRLIHRAPLDRTITVTIDRVPRAEIDAAPSPTHWLDDQWLRLDRQLAADSSNRQTLSRRRPLPAEL